VWSLGAFPFSLSCQSGHPHPAQGNCFLSLGKEVNHKISLFSCCLHAFFETKPLKSPRAIEIDPEKLKCIFSVHLGLVNLCKAATENQVLQNGLCLFNLPYPCTTVNEVLK
jgi:hypothetical protein